MNETQRALLNAIIDDPDEHFHRSVYADWLDENGEPGRAKLIRAMLASGRAYHYPVGDEISFSIAPPLTSEQIENPTASLIDGIMHVKFLPATPGVGAIVEDGLPSRLWCDCNAMFEPGGIFETVLADWPVTHLTLIGDPDQFLRNSLDRVWEHEGMILLSDIEFFDNNSPQRVLSLIAERTLAARRHLSGRKPLRRHRDQPPTDLGGGRISFLAVVPRPDRSKAGVDREVNPSTRTDIGGLVD